MSGTVGLSSINCTSCGAGLSVLGGGRVLAQVCGYCGAVLDAQDNYKVLDSIGKRNHPASPVQIGQTCTLVGVQFTVIGTLGMVENHRGMRWRWVEHQIFSPTHGYLWLNVEDGALTFSRKVRDFDMGYWLTPAQVEAAETPPRLSHGGQSYRYYETSVAEIDFMEGEFNWVPKLGEKVEVVSLLGPDGMLGLVNSANEREVEMTRLLPRDATATEMGFAASALGPETPHALTPYVPVREEGWIKRILAATAVIAGVMGLIFWSMPGREVLLTPGISTAEMPQTYQFEISNTAQLARVQFETNFSDEWASMAAELRGPDGEILLAGERTVSFFSGREGGEAWREGSRTNSFRFRPATEGAHSVTLERLDGEGAGGTVALRVTEGKPTGFWVFALAAVAAIGWIALMGRTAWHQKRRFAGSDWTDEE